MSKIQHNYDFDPTHGFTLEQLLQVAAPPEPDDFADFWQQVYEQSLAGSKNYQIREIWSRLPEVKLFEVRFLSLDEKIITMWLSRPKVSYGAIVYGQGYGNGVWPIQDEYFTVCTVASRGLGPSTQLEIPWEVRQHVVHGIQSRDT
ncbi:MAG: acetylxylan esterase, partial [Lentisphaeria bacterium]|nr:acetylxylan esterase [Lentisphaeria bacterium]